MSSSVNEQGKRNERPVPVSKTNGGLSVFMYHDVRDANHDYFPRRYSLQPFLSIADFEKHLDYIQENYEVIPATDIGRVLSEVDDRCGKAFLTFDDGLKDHIDVVVPILKQRGLSAGFFIPGEAVTERRMLHSHKIQFILAGEEEEKVVDRLFEILPRCFEVFGVTPRLKSDLWDEFGRSNRPGGTWSREAVFTTRFLREFQSYEFRHWMLERLFEEFVSSDERDFTDSFYLTVSDARTLVDNGMVVGGHGYHSLNSAHESEALQESEIREAFQFVSEEVYEGASFSFFYSYPNGGYTKRSLAALADVGCRGAFTTKREPFSRGSILEIPRLDGPADFGFVLD